MKTFFKFFYEILSQFFSGFASVINGIIEGFKKTFSFKTYLNIAKNYKGDFNVGEWVLFGVAILLLLILVAAIVFFIVFLIRKYLRFRKTIVEQESMLDEIADLNGRVATLLKEKEDILAMKVSQIGLRPDESNTIEGATSTGEGEEEVDTNTSIRFAKLHDVDVKYENYKQPDYGNTFSLSDLVELFRNFAASQLGLYYKSEMIRLFISALASTKLVILQGISGTGKTSLAYAWGKFLKHDSCVASVQPSWRDRSELFGYFNEFTKKFNESDILKELYEAGKDDEIHTVILDEMNISRVEYYFAEMLSILEMPNQDEWIVEVVSSGWPSDPVDLKSGKLKIPPNCWYIGTINNDDSTFMVTDKVYDRAMPIDINDKGQVFEPTAVQAQDINYSYLNKLFQDAISNIFMSDEVLAKIEEMDDYVIQHFRIAFGNRIVAHMKKFVPVYMACGGDEVDGVDYFIARKILRKFEQLNISFIRDEIDGFVDFLNKTFGENKMHECIEFMLRLKKLS